MVFDTTCLALVAASLLPASLLALPQLVLDAEKQDFATVFQGITVEHRFRIENTGNAPLEIERIRPSCAPCAAAMVRGQGDRPWTVR